MPGRSRMAAVDASWLHMDRPTNELIVNAVLWFDEPLDDDLVREAIGKRLVAQHARFTQRVEDRGSSAWWVDVPGFDPMTHVTRERLSGAADRRELMECVGRLVSVPLPCDRPLWRVHVVDGYAGGTALVARMHHCIADGVALFRVLLSLSDEAQDGRLPPPQEPRPPASHSLARRASLVAVGGAKIVRSVAALVAMPPDRRTPLRTTLGTDKSIRWTLPLPLDAVKTAARASGATVNDLVLAALTGALRRRFAEAAGDPRDVRAILPVNLRRLDQVEIELGNRFGIVFLRLPVTTPDGAGRISLIRHRTAALKHSATPVVALGVLRLVGATHRRVVQLLVSVFTAKGSLVVTNVPGPRHPLHLGGHRLAGVIAWPPQSGSIGVGVSVISYAGQLVLGLMADDHALPDPEGFLADLRTELGELGVAIAD